VLFLTDGMPTVGETNASRIADIAQQQLGGARLFTFGLGADVNSSLLETLSMDGRGTAQFVRPEEDVERMVGVVADRLTDPVATDLRVTVNGRDVQLRDMVPAMPLDLFGGEDLVVMARYAGNGSARVTVEGRSHGHAIRWTSDARFADASADNGFIPRLWAAQRIGYLSAERRRHGGNAEVDGEIRALGERYGIPTEFTSYLVTEPQYGQANASPPGTVRRDAQGRPMLGGGEAHLNAIVVTGNAAAGGNASMANSPAPQAAFEAAKMASAQRAATSTAMLDSLTKSMADASGAPQRTVNGHTFTLRDGRWTDNLNADSTQVVKVQAYSTSYFALLDRIPALREMAALGDRVLMTGRGVSIEVVAQAPELAAAELDRVVRNW
jgi:Ca-activated chloride channel family protein